ncbi:MAG: LD-carboxypeptidase [candidate division KSB1 bacterium]|nr:LD-carboxypeptidase [candidate division KSB1 bacterium]MDZ7341435.1 LD-carboxypeptidase [candidate division KSB1 bacterium]
MKDIIKPLPLTRGAKIGIISPASRPLDEIPYRLGLDYLRQLGYIVVESEHALHRRGYLAGEDDHRASDFNAMVRDSEIAAIICSRGGYGTPRLLDRIDYDAVAKQPKIIVGYSDITALQLAIWARTGVVTFSGPMVAVEMGRGIAPFTEASFWTALSAAQAPRLLTNPPDNPIRVMKPGRAAGRLLGGCLSLINVLLGTPYCPDFDGAILLLEDIDEEPYRVDRYLAQLRLAGILNQVSGIVLGQFIDCVPRDPEKPSLTIEEILNDYFAGLKIPILTNFAYGHGAVKHTIPIGVYAILDTAQGGLILTESTVAEANIA